MIPVLITSAITASASYTALNNSHDRRSSTLLALGHWTKIVHPNEIMLCDGTAYDFQRDEEFKKYINSGIEMLSFQNNREAVSMCGKGWGEGEIIEWALKNSERLRVCDAFAKCTSKLWVENHRKILESYCGGAMFDFNGKTRIDRIDTRYYVIEKKMYDALLIDAYKEVQDDTGNYLEVCFTNRLRGLSPKKFVIPFAPDIRGASGSMGTEYLSSKSKLLLRTIRNGLYRKYRK